MLRETFACLRRTLRGPSAPSRRLLTFLPSTVFLSYPDHPGRPGQRGGSLPRDATVLTGDELGPSKGSRLAKLAKRYAERKLVGKTFPCPAIDASIGFTRSETDHGIFFRRSDDKTRIVPGLPRLLRSARVVDRQSDRHARWNIVEYVHLRSTVVLSGHVRDVRIVVRHKQGQGYTYYWHRIEN